MQSQKITLIALAVFSISILLAQNNVDKVYAFAIHDVGSVVGGQIRYNGIGNKYIVSTTGPQTSVSTVSSTSFTASSFAVESSTYNTGFDCSLTIDVCVFTQATANDIIAYSSSGALLWEVTNIDGNVIPENEFLKIYGNTAFIGVICDLATTRIAKKYSISDGTFIGDVGSCGGTVFGTAINTIDAYLSGTTLAITLSTTSGSFQLWNTVTNTRICQSSSLSLASPEGTIIRIGSTWYVADGTTMQAFNDSCVDGTDITTASHGRTTITHLNQDTSRSEFYVHDLNGFAVMNTTALTQLLFSVSCSTESLRLHAIVGNEFDQIACINDTSNNVRIISLAEGGVLGEATVCVDTNLDGVTDVCFTDTNNDGVADSGLSGSFGTFRVGQNTTTSANQIVCAVGLSDVPCTNFDTKTNGVGYILLLALIIFSLMFVYGGAKYAGYDLQTVPLYLVGFILLVDTGIAFFLGWIDGLLFYTLIFVFVGLGSLGIAQKVLASRSSSSGGG